MSSYSQWFFSDGWLVITALGAFLGWFVGLRSYIVVIPLVLLAVLGKGT